MVPLLAGDHHVPGESCASLPSVARLSGLGLTRGFASPPRGGFALIGKGSPAYVQPLRTRKSHARNKAIRLGRW